MLLNNVQKLAFGSLITCLGLMIAYAPAHGSLVGDRIDLELLLDGDSFPFPPQRLVTDPSTTHSIQETGSNGITFFMGIKPKADSFDIIYFAEDPQLVSTIWIISDLDWIDSPRVITGVNLTSGNTNLVNNISFTDDSITINFMTYLLGGVGGNISNPDIWSFAIQSQPINTPIGNAIPEPETVFGLLGIGFFKVISTLTKKRKSIK